MTVRINTCFAFWVALAAILVNTGRSQSPVFNDVVALPVELPVEETPPPPLPVNPPTAPTTPTTPSTTTTTTTTTSAASPAAPPSTIASLSPSLVDQTFGSITEGSNSVSVGTKKAGGSTSCTFSVNRQSSDFKPKNESFSYPRATISQALKGTVAEQVLRALQVAKQRHAEASSAEGLLAPGRLSFPDLAPPPHSGGPQISLLPPVQPSDGGLLLGTPTNNNNLNIKNNNFLHPLGSNFAFPDPGQSQFPSTSNNNNNNNDNNGVGQINALLGVLGNLDKQKQLQQQSQPTTTNRNIDGFFPGSKGVEFPEASFFGPERFNNAQTSSAANSPFGFYGFQGLTPLASAGASAGTAQAARGGGGGIGASVTSSPGGGAGNGVSYTVNGGVAGQGGSPFEVNPFSLGDNFPHNLRRRKRRQAGVGGKVSGVCESEPMQLMEYTHYGDRCYVVEPLLQEITFVTCSNQACSGCNYPDGQSRCLEDVRGVWVWAYCEGGPNAKHVYVDYIHLAVGCYCKVMNCS